MNIAKTYSPQEFEEKLYKEWEKKGYFKATVNKTKESFSIVIPPPNITGQLHMGHALNNSIQDTIVRYKRMQGFSTLWIPGTDHASIATEVKIVEKMKSEGITKADIGREGFLERAWEWKEQYGGRIVEQLKRLGSSCDWSREAFTMDNNLSNSVKKVFISLYDKGLIYKSDRIINWCPSCKTALSDAEVEYEEKDSFLWHIRYPLADGSGEVVVATTRPETMVGDTAVAVNPTDERYADMVGKSLILPLMDKLIPVIADDYVEKDFGSGAVKITPAHDPNDFEVGVRHNLEIIRVMNDDGSMNELAGKYCGLDSMTARRQIVADLQACGYLVKTEPYAHNVGVCYRCHSVVEPLTSKQWYVKMEPLAKPAIKVVKQKKVEFLPARFSKTYFSWMENIKDWCISRQLWWGHRIPAFYCDDCGEIMVLSDAPSTCCKCNSTNIRQDEDVLDTWFSSALWPFSTLGYPEKNEELDYFYPTSLLVTAYDIIFFWVARMIFSGIEHMGEIPFPEVLIHGIVRDSEGRKMSKSLGNGIDPLEVISNYGADSLRMSLMMGIAPGGDTRYVEEKVVSCRNFINKVWNASRFVMMNSEGVKLKDMGSFRLSPADKWILSKLNNVIKDSSHALDKYDLGLSCSKIYDFVWNDFCDWYIELSKSALHSDNANKKANTVTVLNYVLDKILKLLHPFIPFVTDEIYRSTAGDSDSIMISKWPEVLKKYNYKNERANMENVMDIIKGIRNLRLEMDVKPSKKIKLIIAPTVDVKHIDIIMPYIVKMANIESVEYVVSRHDVTEKNSVIISAFGDIVVPLGDLIDTDKEIARLSKEIADTDNEIARAEKMLANTGFVARAPKSLIDSEKSKLANYQTLRVKLVAQLGEMQNG